MKQSIIILILILMNSASVVSQIPVVTNEGYILMDEDGDTYNKVPYEFIGREYNSSWHIVFDKGRFGYLIDIGRMGINPQYDIAYPFKGDFALVGKGGKYYHINKSNIVLDTLSQPYAPKVIDNYFLLINNENTSNIVSRDGEIVYHTKDSLFLTKKSSLIQWNQKQKKVSLLRPRYYNKTVESIKELSSIDSIMMTREGYLIVFYKENEVDVFSVFDNVGRDLIVKEASSDIDYKSIKVFGNMIYIPNKSDRLIERHSDYGFGSKYYWDTDKMYYIRINQSVPHSLYLGSNFVKELVAKIKGSEKYAPFNGRKIEGNRLFDKIGTKGKNLLPVRISDNWFLWSRRKDTLIPVNFRYFHPIGIQKATYFGSNTGEKWALVNYETGLATEEKYTLPHNNPLYRNNWVGLYNDNPNPYEWEKNMVRVKEDDNYQILNLKGEKLLTENSEAFKRIENYIKDTFNFKGEQFPITKNLKMQFSRNKVSLKILQDDGNITLYFANRTRQHQKLGYSKYYCIILEAKDRDGVWKQISKFEPPFGIDHNLGTSILKNHYIKKTLPKFGGNFKTQLRAVYIDDYYNLGYKVLSNEIEISINSAKFWVDKYHHIYGIE